MTFKTALAAALACAFIASAAQADVVLDQASMPETGLVQWVKVGSGFTPSDGIGSGQSFAAGQAGQLTRIDLALLDGPFSDAPGGLTFTLEDISRNQLFSTHIDYSDVPEDGFDVDFSQMLQIDLSAANIAVAPGQLYRMFLVPDATSGTPGPGWYYILNDTPLSYANGQGLIIHPQFGILGTPAIDYGFRTYVDVDTAVPEPGTWALLILGFGGAGAALRSRRRAATLAA